MEREILLSGVGGQGVQLAARILALAATREDRRVMSLGTYGGTMRGGNTDSTVVVADGEIASPPIVSRAWAALVAHPRFSGPARSKLRKGGILCWDDDLVESEEDRAALVPGGVVALPVPATRLAREADATRAASLVLLAAFCTHTGLVGLDSLVAGMEESVPSYRRQHVADNTRALESGSRAVSAAARPAFAAEEPAA